MEYINAKMQKKNPLFLRFRRPMFFYRATHFGLSSLPMFFWCATLFCKPSLPLFTLQTRELRSTVTTREYISSCPYSELRSCLSTREHCSELSTHSGFHSVSSAPVFHSRALLRVLHPLWVYTLLFHSRALFPGSPPALGLHISTYNLGTSLYSA